jgi:membrane associated rhomboid family serine protease
METPNIIGTAILLLTGLVTYKGLHDYHFKEAYIFEVDKILIGKEYKRLLSSSFLHAGWLHFGFNMLALLSFSASLEVLFGSVNFLILYFASMIGGDLLALYIHRNHGDYRALGASGAVSGVIFASIVLFPDATISFFLLPFHIKSWIFGILFVLISIFAIKRQSADDNIGHEAHLGGAIVGTLLTPLFAPSFLEINWWIIAAIVLPTAAFLILIVRNPAVMMVEKYWGENVEMMKNWKQKPPETKRSRAEELDDLLDKIRRSGMKSLSKKEKERLDELTKDV